MRASVTVPIPYAPPRGTALGAVTLDLDEALVRSAMRQPRPTY